MTDFYVYILSNHSRTLYTGVTNSLERRLAEHRAKAIPGFTRKYNLTKLIYAERFACVKDAISREKQIKGWTRAKKIKLIESVNPGWKDISID
ncbi:MAG TPA: endonuclease [candidate division Zixibacteria bacterium]|jgi:putative endonuclease|nr:endonuclease [candidate division Zixibacteria bacterium]